IRAYPAIRVVENLGNTQLSDEFIKKLENHEGYGVVLENLKLLEGVWKRHLRRTANKILNSPLNVYI
ncbi:hypothetical protein KY342_03950, partial [Candidatus Woesearchaeota archaeon]|nr:hypothetical protein [Candidatus Woesearchaeota archaeon]